MEGIGEIPLVDSVPKESTLLARRLSVKVHAVNPIMKLAPFCITYSYAEEPLCRGRMGRVVLIHERREPLAPRRCRARFRNAIIYSTKNVSHNAMQVTGHYRR